MFFLRDNDLRNNGNTSRYLENYKNFLFFGNFISYDIVRDPRTDTDTKMIVLNNIEGKSSDGKNTVEIKNGKYLLSRIPHNVTFDVNLTDFEFHTVPQQSGRGRRVKKRRTIRRRKRSHRH